MSAGNKLSSCYNKILIVKSLIVIILVIILITVICFIKSNINIIQSRYNNIKINENILYDIMNNNRKVISTNNNYNMHYTNTPTGTTINSKDNKNYRNKPLIEKEVEDYGHNVNFSNYSAKARILQEIDSKPSIISSSKVIKFSSNHNNKGNSKGRRKLSYEEFYYEYLFNSIDKIKMFPIKRKITVLLIDSGVNIQDKENSCLIESYDLTDSNKNKKDYKTEQEEREYYNQFKSNLVSNDSIGHGTYLSKIICNSKNNRYSNDKLRSVMSKEEVNLISIKIFDLNKSKGNSNINSSDLEITQETSTDSILKALKMIKYLPTKPEYINLSFGSINFNEVAIEKEIRKLVNLGYVFLVSSGNDGPNFGSINFPGNLAEVITVSSISDKDYNRIKSSSSRGPTRINKEFYAYTKPEVFTLSSFNLRNELDDNNNYESSSSRDSDSNNNSEYRYLDDELKNEEDAKINKASEYNSILKYNLRGRNGSNKDYDLNLKEYLDYINNSKTKFMELKLKRFTGSSVSNTILVSFISLINTRLSISLNTSIIKLFLKISNLPLLNSNFYEFPSGMFNPINFFELCLAYESLIIRRNITEKVYNQSDVNFNDTNLKRILNAFVYLENKNSSYFGRNNNDKTSKHTSSISNNCFNLNNNSYFEGFDYSCFDYKKYFNLLDQVNNRNKEDNMKDNEDYKDSYDYDNEVFIYNNFIDFNMEEYYYSDFRDNREFLNKLDNKKEYTKKFYSTIQEENLYIDFIYNENKEFNYITTDNSDIRNENNGALYYISTNLLIKNNNHNNNEEESESTEEIECLLIDFNPDSDKEIILNDNDIKETYYQNTSKIILDNNGNRWYSFSDKITKAKLSLRILNSEFCSNPDIKNLNIQVSFLKMNSLLDDTNIYENDNKANGDINYTNKSNITKVVLNIILTIIPPPNRNKRILIDYYHNLIYPFDSKNVLKDDLYETKYLYDWQGDSISTNYFELYSHLKQKDYYIEELKRSIDINEENNINGTNDFSENVLNNYSVFIIIDIEKELTDKEILILRDSFENNKLSLLIMQNWSSSLITSAISNNLKEHSSNNNTNHNNNNDIISVSQYYSGSSFKSLNKFLIKYGIEFDEQSSISLPNSINYNKYFNNRNEQEKRKLSSLAVDNNLKNKLYIKNYPIDHHNSDNNNNDKEGFQLKSGVSIKKLPSNSFAFGSKVKQDDYYFKILETKKVIDLDKNKTEDFKDVDDSNRSIDKQNDDSNLITNFFNNLNLPSLEYFNSLFEVFVSSNSEYSKSVLFSLINKVSAST